MRTCIIGGGLMGMALAFRLAREGESVTVIESESQVGGLSTWKHYGDFTWDKFYHVILPTDRHLIRFVDDLGLSDELEWRRTYTGFYVDNELYSISSNLEFLKFPLLSLVSKARLAFTMLYCARIDDWKKLEHEPVEDFLVRISGRETYEKLWQPLLLAKLGENYRRVSAVFIWSYIKRLFSAREKSANAEHLGHVRGGYRRVFERVGQEISAAGGQVRLGEAVSSVDKAPSRRLRVVTDRGAEEYDNVICTSPVPVLEKIAAPGLLEVTGAGDAGVEYLGVVCPVLVSRKPLVPYYVVNIADQTLPFTGVIGMSTVIDPAQTAGRYVTYLPKYVLSTDDYLRRDNASIEAEFMDGVRRMLPDFDLSSIESVHVHRAIKVQPLQVLGYSDLVPKVSTQAAGFHVLNTTQFVNSTLNNNEVIGAVDRFHEEYRASRQRQAA